MEQALQEIADNESKRDLIHKRQAVEQAEIADASARLDVLKRQRDEGAGSLALEQRQKVSALRAQLDNIATTTGNATADMLAEIAKQRQRLITYEADVAKVARHSDGSKRIAELKAREKDLSAQIEELNRQVFLTEEFTRRKVAMTEEGINSKFKHARFKLFDQQINGGISDCCEVLYQGVPYGTGLNNAARINVGIDVINTLAEFYGLTAPIFIDNAEAVTKLEESTAQMIRLIVSEPDKTMRVKN